MNRMNLNISCLYVLHYNIFFAGKELPNVLHLNLSRPLEQKYTLFNFIRSLRLGNIASESDNYAIV